MGRGLIVVVACAVALALCQAAEAQESKRRDRIVADMTAMMEYMCLRIDPEPAARAKCVAEHGGAMKEMIRLLQVPDPVARARNSRLFQMCNDDNITRHGIDMVASLACFRKF